MAKIIKLIESEREFEQKDIDEIKGFLSKLPFSHLRALEYIERLPILMNAYADSSPWGEGGEIRIADDFYHLNKEEREFVFLHEMGHNYFDFRDENEGCRSSFKWGKCTKEEVNHLLRVRWMELGWELNPKIWKRVIEKINPIPYVLWDKYAYTAKLKDPNKCMREWICKKGKIAPKNNLEISFRYDRAFYSPKEEMADAYALFLTDRESLEKAAKTGKTAEAKCNFMAECFKEDRESGGKIIFRNYKVPEKCL